mmetsp:Transcript_12714/g.39278  ORF Transcript_12714/g.39278 Transcript_12714/m.39278 type:complete len:227 (+) Transcript_12714:287-967(+)
MPPPPETRSPGYALPSAQGERPLSHPAAGRGPPQRQREARFAPSPMKAGNSPIAPRRTCALHCWALPRLQVQSTDWLTPTQRGVWRVHPSHGRQAGWRPGCRGLNACLWGALGVRPCRTQQHRQGRSGSVARCQRLGVHDGILRLVQLLIAPGEATRHAPRELGLDAEGRADALAAGQEACDEEADREEERGREGTDRRSPQPGETGAPRCQVDCDALHGGGCRRH